MKNTIIIIDYGSGNLRSAAKAFEHVCTNEALAFDVKISSDPEDILKASRLVLPGQGAFGDCIDSLRAIPGMVDALEENVLQNGAPFLGICVGMQLMATMGLEHGTHEGLGWIEGQVIPLKPNDPSLKIPHMGWNNLVFQDTGPQDNRHFVLRNTETSPKGPEDYYFVHSFMFECKYRQHILALSDYGGLFPAVVGRDNMVGVQFHPEKSQDAGLRLISDFLHWKP